MNNYSYFQKLLHKIALSSNFIREVFFDLEKSFFLKKDCKIGGEHVFVSGMARSGTTILLNAIYNTKDFASLTYRDMPFVLSPNIWAKFFKSSIIMEKKERAHKDGIKININSPEAFEEVFWKTFPHHQPDASTEFTNFIE